MVQDKDKDKEKVALIIAQALKNKETNGLSPNSENTNQSDESTTAEIITPLSNDISKMKSLFEAFDGVTTSSDSDYFYISSTLLSPRM